MEEIQPLLALIHCRCSAEFLKVIKDALSVAEAEIVQKEFDRIVLHAVYYIVSKQKYIILCIFNIFFPDIIYSLLLIKVSISQILKRCIEYEK